MSKFKITETGIEGMKILKPTVYEDGRGYFMETFNLNHFKELGLESDFVQDNQSHSQKGVLRGLHMQRKHPQGKLVRVLRGEVFDVGVDARKDSRSFGKWFGITLSGENKKMLYLPEGLLHGFLVLSEEADFEYKCTEYYCQGDEVGVVWNDKYLNIEWPLDKVDNVILSEKDKNLNSFEELFFI